MIIPIFLLSIVLAIFFSDEIINLLKPKTKPKVINPDNKYQYFDIEHKTKENKFYPRFDKQYIQKNYKGEYYNTDNICNAIFTDTKENAIKIIDEFIIDYTIPKSIIIKI